MYGRAAGQKFSDAEIEAGVVIDLFCDLIHAKAKQPNADENLYPFLKSGLSKDKSLFIDAGYTYFLNNYTTYGITAAQVGSTADYNEAVNVLKTSFKDLTSRQTNLLILVYVFLMTKDKLKGELEWAIMNLFISICKTGNPTPSYLDRKSTNFGKTMRTNGLIFSDSLQTEIIQEIWKGIDFRLGTGAILIDKLIALKDFHGYLSLRNFLSFDLNLEDIGLLSMRLGALLL